MCDRLRNKAIVLYCLCACNVVSKLASGFLQLDARLREEVDLVATANQYNQIRLPEVITLIMSEG
jgi:hypothetical protein